MKKLIIFDYDGVIVDSFPALHEVYQEMCQSLGKDCPKSLEEFKKIYGHRSSEAYENLGFSEDEVLLGNKFYKENIIKKNVQPFEGIIETIKELAKSYNMVVVSSCPTNVIEIKLDELGISKYFKEIIGREKIGPKWFEKAGSIKTAVEKHSTTENTISIGDRNIDFIEGVKAGLKNILLVDYGGGYDLSLIPEYKQKTKVTSPKELIEAIKQF